MELSNQHRVSRLHTFKSDSKPSKPKNRKAQYNLICTCRVTYLAIASKPEKKNGLKFKANNLYIMPKRLNLFSKGKCTIILSPV